MCLLKPNNPCNKKNHQLSIKAHLIFVILCNYNVHITYFKIIKFIIHIIVYILNKLLTYFNILYQQIFLISHLILLYLELVVKIYHF